MSKKICRTCLKWAGKTYKTHENLYYPGEKEQLKISDMLRHLVPELYLGVTVSPEICEECKLILRSAYSFRKKCLSTENKIGTYLKKSRCNAASIELVAVLHFLEQQKKDETSSFQGKAQEIISEWDDDASIASQESGETNETLAQKCQASASAQKELTLSPELGVFVDKQGNCYNADGMSIAHPQTIVNTQRDFIQISEVYSINEEDETEPKTKGRKPPEVKASDPKRPRLSVIPDAKLNFGKKTVSAIPEAKTDLAKRIEGQGKSKKSIVAIKSAIEKNPKTVMPIIVDVRSECELGESSKSLIPSNSTSEMTSPESGISKPAVKVEPVEGESSQSQEDEDTLSAPEINTPDNIQGIIDNLPETFNKDYVDVPEFVHINNFSMKDLENLRQQNPQPITPKVVGEFSNTGPFSNVSRSFKTLPVLLPKPDLQPVATLMDQPVPGGTKPKKISLSETESYEIPPPDSLDTKDINKGFTMPTTSTEQSKEAQAHKSVLVARKPAKTSAQRNREYRARKKVLKNVQYEVVSRKPAKTSAQRNREYRARKKVLKNVQYEVVASYQSKESQEAQVPESLFVLKNRPKTGAERNREYRARRKALKNAANEHLPCLVHPELASQDVVDNEVDMLKNSQNVLYEFVNCPSTSNNDQVDANNKPSTETAETNSCQTDASDVCSVNHDETDQSTICIDSD